MKSFTRCRYLGMSCNKRKDAFTELRRTERMKQCDLYIANEIKREKNGNYIIFVVLQRCCLTQFRNMIYRKTVKHFFLARAQVHGSKCICYKCECLCVCVSRVNVVESNCVHVPATCLILFCIKQIKFLIAVSNFSKKMDTLYFIQCGKQNIHSTKPNKNLLNHLMFKMSHEIVWKLGFIIHCWMCVFTV